VCVPADLARQVRRFAVVVQPQLQTALAQIGSANRLELSEQNELMTRDEPVEES
jgi:hypothetical protein